MTTVNVTDENFDNEVLKSSKPTVVDFWAEWCGPCKQIGPTLEEISDENDEEKLKFLDELNEFVMSIQKKYENV